MEHELTGPPWLDARLKRGEVVILDGAMGTELEARGVPMDGKAWSGAAMLEHGAAVRQVHADYIRAGADVIITNSFATGRHALEPAGFGAEVAEINRRAVALAREAREEAADRPVAIAGSICSWVPVEESGWRAPDRLADAASGGLTLSFGESHREDRARRRTHDLFRHAAQQHALDGALPVGAHDNQVDLMFLGVLIDLCRRVSTHRLDLDGAFWRLEGF